LPRKSKNWSDGSRSFRRNLRSSRNGRPSRWHPRPRRTWTNCSPGARSGRPTWAAASPAWPSLKPIPPAITWPPLQADCSRPLTTALHSCISSIARTRFPSAPWLLPRQIATSSGSAPAKPIRGTAFPSATASIVLPTVARPGRTWALENPSRSARSSFIPRTRISSMWRLWADFTAPAPNAASTKPWTAAKPGNASGSSTTGLARWI